MKIVISKVESDEHLNACLAVRHTVFVVGQNVPLELEIDGLDEACDHYMALVDGRIVGTGRVRFVEGIAKIERVAVLEEYRAYGLGRQLMVAMMDDLQQQHADKSVMLSAQTDVIPFYEKLGFATSSDIYMDAGIPHKDMRLVTNAPI